MLKWLKPAKPPRIWVIKQIDHDVLHLCGQGIAEGRQRHKEKLAALAEGSYQGPVRLANSGLVLNSALFAALVPLDALRVDEDERAHWQGAVYRIAWVPQRCWVYIGRLVVQEVLVNGQPCLTSTEDVSDIRAKASPSAHDRSSDTSLFSSLDLLSNVSESKDEPASSRNFQAGRGRERRNKDDD